MEGEVLTSGQNTVSEIVPGVHSAGPWASFIPCAGTAFRWRLLAPPKKWGNRGSERLRDSPRVTCFHQGIARPLPQVWRLFRLLSGGSEGESEEEGEGGWRLPEASNSC